MPLAKRSKIKSERATLREYFERLDAVLEGEDPNENLWDHYALNEADFSRDFTHVDEASLVAAADALDAIIKKLKKPAHLKAPRLHMP